MATLIPCSNVPGWYHLSHRGVYLTTDSMEQLLALAETIEHEAYVILGEEVHHEKPLEGD